MLVRKCTTSLLIEEDKIYVAQGVSGTVTDRGSVLDFIPYICQGLRHAFQDLGVRGIAALHSALFSGNLRFERRSPGAQTEGNIHSLHDHTTPDFTSQPGK